VKIRTIYSRLIVLFLFVFVLIRQYLQKEARVWLNSSMWRFTSRRLFPDGQPLAGRIRKLDWICFWLKMLWFRMGGSFIWRNQMGSSTYESKQSITYLCQCKWTVCKIIFRLFLEKKLYWLFCTNWTFS